MYVFMKKFAILMILAIASTLVFSQNQPQLMSGSLKGNVVTNPSNAPMADPTDPLLYSQPVVCSTLASSEIMSDLNLESLCADDFTLTATKNITAIKWWAGPWNGSSSFANWNIKFYDDASCLPGTEIASFAIPFAQSNQSVTCSGYLYSFWCTLPTPVLVQGNSKYWVSVQTSDHPFTGQWGWEQRTPVNGCSGAFKSVYFGFPNFVPNINVFGSSSDQSFELYGTDYTPPLETPVSNWALFIGIGLILVAAVVRFRRLI
jgi:hypothetical protein